MKATKWPYGGQRSDLRSDPVANPLHFLLDKAQLGELMIRRDMSRLADQSRYVETWSAHNSVWGQSRPQCAFQLGELLICCRRQSVRLTKTPQSGDCRCRPQGE